MLRLGGRARRRRGESRRCDHPREEDSDHDKEHPTKRPSRKALDQIGIILLISGVVVAMGVSAVRGLSTWVQILGLGLGIVLVIAGLAMARTFRSKDSDRG